MLVARFKKGESLNIEAWRLLFLIGRDNNGSTDSCGCRNGGLAHAGRQHDFCALLNATFGCNLEKKTSASRGAGRLLRGGGGLLLRGVGILPRGVGGFLVL